MVAGRGGSKGGMRVRRERGPGWMQEKGGGKREESQGKKQGEGK
jgi:hypothetical protein